MLARQGDRWLTFPNGSAKAGDARVAYAAMSQVYREWMFWAATAACVMGETFIVISSVRALRGSAGKKAAREALWAILPAIALAWLLVATWTEVRRSGAHEHMSMPMPTSGA